tara:strand:- start:2079 stop:2774 length:696 start_codon:yes stop_codon:yes gene_type:complete
MDKMNCLYVRVSKDTQENSIDTQLELLKKYCQYKELNIDKTFIDFGKSGGSIKGRDEFNKMMKLVQGGNVSKIITTSLSRFSRNTMDLLSSVDTLKENNTDLIVLKENISSLYDPIGMFFVSILGSIYTLERGLISERTKDVLRHKRLNMEVSGTTPIGYDRIGDSLIENEKEQFMLRKIKRLRFQGRSYQDISRFLNRNGYTNKSGGNFTKHSVGSIVKNRGFVVGRGGN